MTMLSIILFAFMLCGALSENINCQFKPGCDVNHCDPSPESWNKPGFNIDEYLKKKQFPITCGAQQKKSSDDVFRLCANNADNLQEIKALKQDIRNLVQEVSALKKKNKNAENEIRKLQEKLELGATDTTTSKPVTTPEVKTTSKTTTPGTNVLDILRFRGKRYIALTSSSDNVNKATAESKCQSLGGNLANFYSRTHMNKIMNYIRQNKLNGSNFEYFHLGMTYDPIKKILRLRDGTKVSSSDYKWNPTFPRNGAKWATYTNMVIGIDSVPSSIDQYLYHYPDYNNYVLCEI